jgi:hypothetical protein
MRVKDLVKIDRVLGETFSRVKTKGSGLKTRKIKAGRKGMDCFVAQLA